MICIWLLILEITPCVNDPKPWLGYITTRDRWHLNLMLCPHKQTQNCGTATEWCKLRIFY